MQRDGTLTSLWQNAMPNYQPQNLELPNGQLFDVMVVGGGITGVTTALLLQKAGKKCLLAEAHNLGFGTSSGTTAHLNTIMDNSYDVIIKDFGEENARLVARGACESIELIKQHVQEYNIDCAFEELPGYVFSQDESQTSNLADILEATRKVGVAADYTDSLPIPVPFEKVMQVQRQAQFHPTRYLYALAKAFEDAGGRIVQNCLVTGLEEKDMIEAITSQGIFQTRQVIYATHIPPGVNVLHFRNAPYRSYAMAVKLKGDNYPSGLVYDMYDPYHYYRTQTVDGEKFLIVGGEDHKTAHEQNTYKCFRNLESYIRKHFDVDHVVFEWSSQYFEPVDGLPYIGKMPDSSANVFVATGFGGNGMTYGTLSAIALTQLITESKSAYTDLFNPSRVKPVAGFTTFIEEQITVAKDFVGKWFSKEKIESFAELAPGEGKVVNYEGHAIALYKDESGKLHAVSPTCPHAKCAVDWNMAEKSWDCPCHGSRFDYDGVILTGPARSNLEKVELKEIVEEDAK